jgi:hypothetical protein
MVQIPGTAVFGGFWALTAAYFMPNSALLLGESALRHQWAICATLPRLYRIEDFEGKT